MEVLIERVYCENGDTKPIDNAIDLIKEDLGFLYNNVRYIDFDITPLNAISGTIYQHYLITVLYKVGDESND
jgi:hypothetical protein